MKISPLSEQRHFVDEITKLHHEEWGHIGPSDTLENRRDALILASESTGIPSIYTAHEDDEFVGTAGIVDKDMDSHNHIGPWLSAVYVKNEWRRQGVATLLLNHCEDQARRAGVETLYLFTEFASQLYANNGWLILEQSVYKGANVDVMYKELAD